MIVCIVFRVYSKYLMTAYQKNPIHFFHFSSVVIHVYPGDPGLRPSQSMGAPKRNPFGARRRCQAP